MPCFVPFRKTPQLSTCVPLVHVPLCVTCFQLKNGSRFVLLSLNCGSLIFFLSCNKKNTKPMKRTKSITGCTRSARQVPILLQSFSRCSKAFLCYPSCFFLKLCPLVTLHLGIFQFLDSTVFWLGPIFLLFFSRKNPIFLLFVYFTFYLVITEIIQL